MQALIAIDLHDDCEKQNFSFSHQEYIPNYFLSLRQGFWDSFIRHSALSKLYDPKKMVYCSFAGSKYQINIQRWKNTHR